MVDPFDGSLACCDLMLEIAGYRYYPKDIQLSVGDPVNLAPEPQNPYDPGAVQVQMAGCKIGNINRLQAPAFQQWLVERQVTAVVERLSDRPGKPRAFIFVWIRPA